MKRFLLAIAVLFALGVGALVIVIVTFDADRYRPQLVQELQKALGKPVSLEHVSMGWKQGIALELRTLAIREDTSATREPLLEVDSIKALVRLAPLFRRDVQVTSVTLERPRIHVARDARGALNVVGLAAAASPAAAPSHTTQIGNTSVSFRIGSLHVEVGTLHWTDALTTPSTDLRIARLNLAVTNIAVGESMDIHASAAVAAEAPNVYVKGRLQLPASGQAGSLERMTLRIERLPLEQVVPPARPGEPQVRGQLTALLEGRVGSLSPEAAMQSLDANGRFSLDEPMIANLNVLRSVFDRLSLLPGLVQALEAKLPPEYRAKLSARDTILEPFDVAVRVAGGAARFEDLQIQTDTVRIQGRGRIGLGGQLDIAATLGVEPALSAAIVKSIQELGVLANRQGELEIPVVIQGQAPRVAVLPDLSVIGPKLVTTTIVDLLGRALNEQDPRAQPDLNARSPPEAPVSPLEQLLQRVLPAEPDSTNASPQ